MIIFSRQFFNHRYIFKHIIYNARLKMFPIYREYSQSGPIVVIGNYRLPSASAGQSVPIVKNYNIIIFDGYIDYYRCRTCFRSRMMNSKPADTRKAVRRRSQDLACSIKLADLSTRCTNQSTSSTSEMTNGDTAD